MLQNLRTIGVRVALDDFGTGYSSLGYLRSFPFDKIKIDQTFVRGTANDPAGQAIVRAIASLGQSLGMATVAEGVETEEQLARVAADGCTDVQGYLISRPLPPEQIAGFLTTQPSRRLAALTISPRRTAMTKLYRLVYFSRNRINGGPSQIAAEVQSILAASQRNNPPLELTGALIFNAGVFAQVLEGPRSSVEATFEKIQQDRAPRRRPGAGVRPGRGTRVREMVDGLFRTVARRPGPVRSHRQGHRLQHRQASRASGCSRSSATSPFDEEARAA